ncbi:hypothetical protein SCLCIDRAFT_34735 [Scleroderma citrinum Foug A]|uniref:Uncharacterized protein n=1 Tax=Scleroderma citrinum Foug A TaxID=1036808 RepID=A0A0C3D1P1_9AGAM|nr:hypothetical protein SCLCIDRAFT_34735 [Scleroderma citrinum Foug A]
MLLQQGETLPPQHHGLHPSPPPPGSSSSTFAVEPNNKGVHHTQHLPELNPSLTATMPNLNP